MADGGFPNKNRAINAYDAYGDAMRPYIEQVLERTHGPGWVRSRLLTDDLRKSNDRRYDEVERALRSKKPPLEILDRADIPNLVNGDLANFPDLSRDDARRLFAVRDLRNDIVHSARSGDCTVEEANAIASLCTLALERCGLSEAAENIRRISSAAMPAAQATPEADRREQRERREWDKARLAGKPPEDLTPWEQQRLAEIEWEEEWERRELVRSEREAIAALGDDIDELRGWFDADEARRDRHPPKHAALLQREQERREQREREQRKREQEERERKERERKAHERREQERKEREQRERARERSEQRARERREQRQRELEERDRREQQEQEQRERELLERERAEIAAFGDDIDGLRRWFDADKRRPQRLSEYAVLLQRERRRAEQELGEIAMFGDDIDDLRRWFDMDEGRCQRHTSAYAALEQREMVRRERREIAEIDDDLAGLRRRFDASKGRRQRHTFEYSELVSWEQGRKQREQTEIARFGDDVDGLRRWFDADKGRCQRHTSAYAALEQREREQQHLPPGAVDSTLRADDAPPERERSLFSRIFRR